MQQGQRRPFYFNLLHSSAIALLWIVFSAACAPAPLPAVEGTVATVELTEAAQRPDCQDSSFMIEGVPVKLVSGYSEMDAAPGSSQKVFTRLIGEAATTDLNSDGEPDCAFLLAQETGGSGFFYYLAASLWSSEGYQGINAVFIGDRIIPLSIAAEDGAINIHYLERKPDEPFTNQPTIEIVKKIELVHGQLLPVDHYSILPRYASIAALDLIPRTNRSSFRFSLGAWFDSSALA